MDETEAACKIVNEASRIPVRTLLNLGCGGGHNDHTLKRHFDVTGVDVSEAMLALARRLNPEVRYFQGDMRTVRLGETFDAVTIFDSINYMLSTADLGAALATAHVHLKPGGVLLTCVEHHPGLFRQNASEASVHARDGVEIAFFENVYDPNSRDTTYEVTFVYLIRRGGELALETDRHLCGLFPLGTWHHILADLGFVVEQREWAGVPTLVCSKPVPKGC